MTTQDLQQRLHDLIEGVMFGHDEDDEPTDELQECVHGIDSVCTYDEVGMMTNNQGLVIETDDGSVFQLTIFQSR